MRTLVLAVKNWSIKGCVSISFLTCLFSCASGITSIAVGDQEVFQLKKAFTNVFLIKGQNNSLLVDTGLPGHRRGILKLFKKSRTDPKSLNLVILTHGHPDHGGNAHYLQQEFNAKILVGRGDEILLENGGRDDSLCHYGIMGWTVANTVAKRRYTPLTADIVLDSIESLKPYGFDGYIQRIPGHTKGSIYLKIEEVLIVGDIIRGKLLNQDQPKAHFIMCDRDQNLKQIAALAALDSVGLWLPSHGDPLPIAAIEKFITP
ncbi:MAG: MBL fold metallo-hydrolase [Bacteroidota bacterium]